MKRSVIAVVFFVILAAAHLYVSERAAVEKDRLAQVELDAGLILPSNAIKLMSLDFDGVVSDLLFLKAMMFFGIAGETNSYIQPSQWRWIYKLLDTATDLDPYFLDPYYLANAYLTGSAGLINEANMLLEKGSRARTWDWMLPYFLGFNNFYYLNSNETAAAYLMEAARRPGPSRDTLAGVAAKLVFKERRTETAILFLQEMYNRTSDEGQRSQYKKRLSFLERMLGLEQAVERYKKQYKKIPAELDVLKATGMLAEQTQDPYGGSFYLDGGVVHSTSEWMFLPGEHK